MLDNAAARKSIEKIVDPVAKLLLKLGLTPNQVTVIGTIGISLIAIFFFSQGKFFSGTLFILLLIFSDLLDGTMARISNEPNPIGSFLDSTLDRVTDAALFGSMAIYFSSINSILFYPAITTALAAQLISYVRAKAESEGLSMEVGVAERPERIILLLIGTGFTGLGISYILDVTTWLLAVLTIFTVAQRLFSVYKSD